MAAVPLSEDDVLSAEEAARLLGMDILKVRRLALQGRIPAYRIPGGRKYKFFRSEVDAYATAVAEEAKAKAEAEASADSPVVDVGGSPDGDPDGVPDDTPIAVPAMADAPSSGPEVVPGDALASAPAATPVAEETAG